jgi:hypothetical protein
MIVSPNPFRNGGGEPESPGRPQRTPSANAAARASQLLPPAAPEHRDPISALIEITRLR